MHTRLYGLLVAFAIAGCDRPTTRTIRVFENRARHSGREIGLHVVVLRARGRPVASDPIVVFSGGPGLAAAEDAHYWARVTARLRPHHDVILVDQRGTGRSAPLPCNLYETGRLQPYLDPMYPIDRVRACRRTLERRADLTQYTTDNGVDDMAQILDSLGVHRADLFGISYGSHAALAFLQRHPDRVRTVVLSAIWPPERTPFASPELITRALAASDSGHVIDSAMARLRQAPVTVTLWNWSHLRRESVTITARGFAERIFTILYTPSRARRVIGFVRLGLAGDWTPFARAALLDSRTRRAGRYWGMTLTVFCTESAPRLARLDTARLAATSPIGLPVTPELLAACAEWPNGVLAPEDTMPVASAAPVLLLEDGLDPATPPEWADSAAAHLPNSRRDLNPTGGHAFMTDERMARVAAFIDSAPTR
jgi:pimeloyl-ACP methyl ester carboxylesterase